jgi:hypothetical protein
MPSIKKTVGIVSAVVTVVALGIVVVRNRADLLAKLRVFQKNFNSSKD